MSIATTVTCRKPACELTVNLPFSIPLARSEGEVRLIGSPNEWEGHIAVYHNGTWGSVCDDGWDINDAQVVCRQLGYHDAVAFHTQSLYVQNVFNHFWYADLECVGLENFLKDCLHSGLGPTKCYPTEEAGVKCSRECLRVLGHYHNMKSGTSIQRTPNWDHIVYSPVLWSLYIEDTMGTI